LQKLLQEMLETYGNRVYRLALRYTGDRVQAQDLTQETFLRAYKYLDRYDSEKPAGPWLFKIAANLCNNWLRDNREIPVEMVGEFARSANPGPEEEYLAKEEENELLRALHEMPSIYRDVLLLKHVSELSYAEIGETLGLEMSLVKNRLYRGRIMLKESLEKAGS
jgi:RNA polymerase sigma-70 factor, ECF subfamily